MNSSVESSADTSQFMCQVCMRQFPSLRLLTSHFKIHTTQQNDVFTCTFCEANFVDKDALEQHFTAHIEEDLAHMDG